MEHYKSTFATVALAMSGLILAAQMQKTGPFSVTPERIARVATEAEADAAGPAWTNPPTRLTSLGENRPAAADVMMSLPPRMTMAELPAPTIASEPAVRTEASRKVTAGHRRRVAQRAVRVRQAAAVARTPETNAAPAPGPAAVAAPAPAKRVDLLGDLIRGLGFGGEG